MTTRPIVRSFTWLSSASGALLIVFLGGCEGSVERVAECPSPDGSLVAYLYVKTGGGATGYTYWRVRVQGLHQSFDPDKYDFQMNYAWGITLEWKDNRHLELIHADSAIAEIKLERRQEVDDLGVVVEPHQGPSADGLLVSPIANSCIGS